LRRKVTPKGALVPHKLAKADLKAVQRIYEKIEERDERIEFNLYISGVDEDNADTNPVHADAQSSRTEAQTS